MGFLVDRSAEQCQKRFTENQISSRQRKAADHTEHNGVADGPMCLLPGPTSQRNAHKGAAAVADKHRKPHGHDCHGKNNGVGSVAVGAKVAGVGNKNLVDNVIQRAHQQRNDAGNGILPHKLADALRSQKLISGIHKIHLSFEK